GPPPEHSVSKDVVVNLVARFTDGAEDARIPTRELLQYRRKLSLRHTCPFVEIGHGVGDLRSRSGDEVAEDVRGDVLLGRCQVTHGGVKVGLDNALSAA